MIPKCGRCGGTTTRRLVTAENWWGEKLTLVENVPAWVCGNCGEEYFDAAVSIELDHLREEQPEPVRIERVPVYALADGRE